MTSISDIPKKRGRPVTTGKGTGVLVRVQPDQLAALDAWIERNGRKLSRPEAIRFLLKEALPNANTTSVRHEFDKAEGA